MKKMILFFVFLATSLSALANPQNLETLETIDSQTNRKNEINYAHRQVLVSAGDLQHNTKNWPKDVCHFIYEKINTLASKNTDITCRLANTSQFIDPELSALRPKFDYHIYILRGHDGVIHVQIINWKKFDEVDFDHHGLTIKDSEKISWKDSLAKVIMNFSAFIEHKNLIEHLLVYNAAFYSNKITVDESVGQFIDQRSKQPIKTSEAKQQLATESIGFKNYYRSGMQLAVLQAVGLAAYFYTLHLNKEDFDYGFKSGIKNKLTCKACRFDDNTKAMNIGHALAGDLYGQVARANGFNSMESLLITLGSSTQWEFLEYREVLSINDQIITGIGGYILAESKYQLACALLQKGGTFAKTIAYSLNPVLATNHAINKYRHGNVNYNMTDCQKPRWSEIGVYIGIQSSQSHIEHRSSVFAGLTSEIIKSSTYDKEGSESTTITDTAKTRFDLEVGVHAVRVISEVVHAAYHKKNMGVNSKGELVGYDFMVGVGSGVTFHARDQGGNDDMYGTVNLLGPTAHVNAYVGGYQIRANVGVFADFVMVKSMAIENFKAANNNDLTGLPSVLQKRDYYWGFGHTVLANVSIRKGRWEIGYSGQISEASIINERDRFMEKVTRKEDFQDQITIHKFWLGFQIAKNIVLQISKEFIYRSGSVGGALSANLNERRTMAVLKFLF